MTFHNFVDSFVLNSQYIRIISTDLTVDGDRCLFVGELNSLQENDRLYDDVRDRNVFYIDVERIDRYQTALNIYIS